MAFAFQVKATGVPQNYGVNEWKFNSATIYDLSGESATIQDLVASTITIPPLLTSTGLNAVTYDTMTHQLSYNPYSLTPPGAITEYAGSTAPNGYLLCDGTAVSRTTYSVLFSVIGVTYGNGDGVATFNIPNLKGKVVVGFDSGQTEFDALGETGGSKTNTLITSQLPAHSHTGTTDSAGTHTHNVTDPGHTHASNAIGGQDNLGLCTADGNNTATVVDASQGELNLHTVPFALTINSATTGISIDSNGAHTHTFTSNNTGNGDPINNLQPYIVLNYIIKY